MAVPRSYTKPRKFNFVTLILLLAALSLAYTFFQFGPPYYRKWKVKGVLSESANMVYPKRFVAAGEWLDTIHQSTVDRLRNDVGIEDKGLTVRIHRDSATITVGADYKERINHPLIKKTTVMIFRPFVQLAIVKN